MHIWDVTQHHYERFLYVNLPFLPHRVQNPQTRKAKREGKILTQTPPQGVWRNTVLYGPAALFIKITLLLIFTRIWAPFHRAVLSINIFIGLLVLYYVPMFVLKIMVCNPVHGFWDFAVEATCLDINKIFLADTIISVVSDFAIIVVPIPLIWDLNLSLVKKMKLFAILGAGGIATIASAARLYYVCKMFGDPDKTVTFVEFSMLGSLELFLGLLCASLPAFNALFTRCLGSRHETGASSPAKSKVYLSSESMGSDDSLQKMGGVVLVREKEDGELEVVRGRTGRVRASYGHFIGRVLRRERRR